MLNHEQFILLSLFADGTPHSFFEICKLSGVALKKSDRKIEKLFSRLLENGWVTRLHKSWAFHLDFYSLTNKGDELYRSVQMRRAADAKTNRYYRYYGRDGKGKYGVNDFDDNITEQSAGLPDKLPELYN